MSRLYGRCDDVYGISHYLVDEELKKYSKDNTITTIDSIVESPSKIEIYLPNNAKDIIENTEIKLSKSILVKEPLTYVPVDTDTEPEICFPLGKPKEEYKKDIMFFIGRILASRSLDYLPKEFDIACEYHDVLPILIEYLYLKENGQENELFGKFSNDLIHNARKYIKIYDIYQKFTEAKRQSDIFTRSERLDQQEQVNKQIMLQEILKSLVPLASMDVTLQITDKLKTEEEYKKLIEILIDNPDHDREKILKNDGYDSYGFKRLRKEIDSNRK